MNVLMIGLDTTLAMHKEKTVGDSQERFLHYGKIVSNLVVVVRSPRNMKLNTRQLSENVVVYPSSSTVLSFPWDAYRICCRICQSNRIDLVVTQDPLFTGLVGYGLKKKFHLPLLMQVHGDYLDSPYWLEENRLNYFLNMLGKWVIRKADRIQVVSPRIRATLLQLGIEQDRISVLPVFFHSRQFFAEVISNSITDEFSKYDGIVLFAGGLVKTKSIETLLFAASEVLRRYPRTLFLFVGDGPEKPRLGALAKELGIDTNTKFAGAVGHEDMPYYYSSCSLLVLPSKNEGWGRVVMESLASGKPVVISSACGCADFVRNEGCGLVFPVGDWRALSHGIVCLLSQPELRKSMGLKGRKVAVEFADIEQNVCKYRELFERTIEIAKSETR